MIDDLLLDKFSRIQDLPVSEETLGAYLEGNLDYVEMNEVGALIADDSTLISEIAGDIMSETIPSDEASLLYDPSETEPHDSFAEMELLADMEQDFATAGPELQDTETEAYWSQDDGFTEIDYDSLELPEIPLF